ncbi:MAG: hypothetical protein M3346_04125 [Actinomycetota bacterium]|nr:hypothetical protein [Actinomycetota bacterium]
MAAGIWLGLTGGDYPVQQMGQRGPRWLQWTRALVVDWPPYEDVSATRREMPKPGQILEIYAMTPEKQTRYTVA